MGENYRLINTDTLGFHSHFEAKFMHNFEHGRKFRVAVTLMDQFLMANLANIDRVLQQKIQRSPGEGVATGFLASLCDPIFAMDILPFKFQRQFQNRSQCQIPLKDMCDPINFLSINYQMAIFDVIYGTWNCIDQSWRRAPWL